LPQREILDRCTHAWNWRRKRRHESRFTAASIERAAATAASRSIAARRADRLCREERRNGRELQPATTVARIDALGASRLRAVRVAPARHASAAVTWRERARRQGVRAHIADGEKGMSGSAAARAGSSIVSWRVPSGRFFLP
jgi:hypothetical protein